MRRFVLAVLAVCLTASIFGVAASANQGAGSGPVLNPLDILPPAAPTLSQAEYDELLAPPTLDAEDLLGPDSPPLSQIQLEALIADSQPTGEPSDQQYPNLNSAQATQLFLETFGDQLTGLLDNPAESLSEADAIDEFINDGTAIIDPAGPKTHALVESMSPLRVNDEIVDLTLTQTDGDVASDNPVVPVTLPTDLGDGLTFERSGINFEMLNVRDAADADLISTDQSPGSNLAFYPLAAKDVDLAVAPIPEGAETFAQLRTDESAENYSMQVNLQEGQTLHATEDGGAVILDEEARELIRVHTPISTDADGRQVPTTLTVEANTIGIHVDHRSGDFEYPVLMDPIIQEVWDWWTPATYSTAGWSAYQTSGSQYQLATTCSTNTYATDSCQGGTATTGRGLYINARPGYSFTNGSFGQWVYNVPHSEFGTTNDTYIAGANVSSWRYLRGTSTTNSNPYGYFGLHGASTWLSGQQRTKFDSAGGTDSFTGNSTAKQFVVGMGSSANVTMPTNKWRYMRLAAISMELRDGNPPAFWSTTVNGAPTTWVAGDEPFEISAVAADAGLGIKTIGVLGAAKAGGWYGATWEAPSHDDPNALCDGTVNAKCPRVATGTIVVDPNLIVNGFSTLGMFAKDALDKTSTGPSFTINIDNYRPAIAVSGEMVNSGVDGTELNVVINDNDPAFPSATPSGIKNYTIKVDGAVVRTENVPCNGGACPSIVERKVNLPVDKVANAPGTPAHTIEVIANDKLDQGRTDQIQQFTDGDKIVMKLSKTKESSGKCDGNGDRLSGTKPPQTFPNAKLWVGSPCNDVYKPIDGIKTIQGGAGDDRIYGGVGNQNIDGGSGDDIILGQRNNDHLVGGPGDDRIYGGIGDDPIYGDAGDTDDGNTQKPWLASGEDQLSGGPGADDMNGGNNDDLLRGGQGLDKMTGAGGIDTVTYADAVAPGFDADSPTSPSNFPGPNGVERGVRIMSREAPEDVPIATNGPAGRGGGRDYLCLLTDNKTPKCKTSDHFEVIVGSPYADQIWGTYNGETILGAGGGDIIYGRGGGDTINGGTDGDYLNGGGSANIKGGPGTNYCLNGTTIESASCTGTTARVYSRNAAPANANAAGPISVGLLESTSSLGGFFPAKDVFLKGSTARDAVKVSFRPNDDGWADDVIRFEVQGKAGESRGRFAQAEVQENGCVWESATKARCSVPGPVGAVLINGGDGNDELSSTGFPTQTTVIIVGGTGRDVLSGEDAEETIIDGIAQGSLEFPEVLSGNGGDDVLLANSGSDKLDGGVGNDLLMNASVCEGANTIDGYHGKDNAQWAQLNPDEIGPGVYVDLGYNGGRYGRFVPGEGISAPGCSNAPTGIIKDVEAIEASSNEDVMIGNDEGNTFLGRAGADKYVGEGGSDTFQANSADRDTKFDCGDGVEKRDNIVIDTQRWNEVAPEPSCDNGAKESGITQYEGLGNSQGRSADPVVLEPSADEGYQTYDGLSNAISSDWEVEATLPVAAYRFDEEVLEEEDTAGVEVFNSMSDQAEGTYEGTNGGPEVGVEGVSVDPVEDQAVSLDGDDDSVQLGNAADPGAMETTGYSVEIWTQFEDSPGTEEVLFSRGSGTNLTKIRRDTDGRIVFETQDGYKKAFVRSDLPIADSAWHHIVGTLDEESISMYIDGFKYEVGYDTSVFPGETPSADNAIGEDIDGSDNAEAVFDDVAIYAEPLDEATVIDHLAESDVEISENLAIEPAETADADGDGVTDSMDNCPSVSNANQADSEIDGIGDACQTGLDSDGDEVLDTADNCPDIYNPGQENTDSTASGDACEVLEAEDDIYDEVVVVPEEE